MENAQSDYLENNTTTRSRRCCCLLLLLLMVQLHEQQLFIRYLHQHHHSSFAKYDRRMVRCIFLFLFFISFSWYYIVMHAAIIPSSFIVHSIASYCIASHWDRPSTTNSNHRQKINPFLIVGGRYFGIASCSHPTLCVAEAVKTSLRVTPLERPNYH
jgi:hypothetical protein